VEIFVAASESRIKQHNQFYFKKRTLKKLLSSATQTSNYNIKFVSLLTIKIKVVPLLQYNYSFPQIQQFNFGRFPATINKPQVIKIMIGYE